MHNICNQNKKISNKKAVDIQGKETAKEFFKKSEINGKQRNEERDTHSYSIYIVVAMVYIRWYI